jgi:hypothetical protein
MPIDSQTLNDREIAFLVDQLLSCVSGNQAMSAKGQVVM